MRDNILEALFRMAPDKQLRTMLAEALNQVAAHDFPERWPALLPQCLAGLQSGDFNRMLAALIALRHLVKKYEFKMDDERRLRDPLNAVIERVFPTLLQLLAGLLRDHADKIEAAQMINVGLKVYWSCMQLPVERSQNAPEHGIRCISQLRHGISLSRSVLRRSMTGC